MITVALTKWLYTIRLILYYCMSRTLLCFALSLEDKATFLGTITLPYPGNDVDASIFLAEVCFDHSRPVAYAQAKGGC